MKHVRIITTICNRQSTEINNILRSNTNYLIQKYFLLLVFDMPFSQSVTKEHLDKTAALHAIASQVQPVIISMATVLIMCVLQDGRTITAAQVRARVTVSLILDISTQTD